METRGPTLTISPLSGALGAEIAHADLAQLDDAGFAAIHAAFLDHQMLVFRDQRLTPAEYAALARRFGQPDIYPFAKGLEGHPEITMIVKEAHQSSNFGGMWHSDTTYKLKPPKATMLIAVETPPVGGDTLFASQYAAYESLSDGLKRTLGGLKGVHDNRIQSPKFSAARNAERTSKLRAGLDETEEPECEHPVVITHPETGRKALYVNVVRTHRFAGMTEEESRPLLEYLFTHSSKPEFTCRFRWRDGSIAFWDNRCVMHRALNDYPGYKRYMNRVTVEGGRPA